MEKLTVTGNIRIKSALTTHKFSKLVEAIQFWKHEPEIQTTHMILSEEICYSGSRNFYVKDKNWFIYNYPNLHQPKHFYEVLNSFAKIYFDLEYDRTVLEIENEDLFVMEFIKLIDLIIHNIMDIKTTHMNYIILDSSNTKKFSKHIIIEFLIMKDDQLCTLTTEANTKFHKRFYQLLQYSLDEYVNYKNSESTTLEYVSKLISNYETYDIPLMMDKKTNRFFHCIDFTVYECNQNFRLVYSSKFGSERVLVFDQRLNTKTYESLTKYNLISASLVTVTSSYIVMNIQSIKTEFLYLFQEQTITQDIVFYKTIPLKRTNNCDNNVVEEFFIKYKLNDLQTQYFYMSYKEIQKYFKSHSPEARIVNVKLFKNIIIIGSNCRFCIIEQCYNKKILYVSQSELIVFKYKSGALIAVNENT